MNRRYSPEQKANALARLAQNAYDTKITAAQTGIPDRTLRTWRRDARMAAEIARLKGVEAATFSLRQPTPSPHARQPQEFKDNVEALEFMRTQLLDELLSSPDDWRGTLVLMSPYQRAQVAIMLLDRLMKLDEHLKPYRPKPVTTYHVIDSEGEEPDGDVDAESPSSTEGNS